MDVNAIAGTDAYDLFTSASERKGNSNALQVTDFLTLLAAQLSNQDMMNPMSDVDFMGQLAQFSVLQSIETLTQVNLTSYSLSLVGREVTAARMNTLTGELEITSGVVSAAGLYNNEPTLFIDGVEFSLAEVMMVGAAGGSQTEESEDAAKSMEELAKTNAMANSLALVGKEVTVSRMNEETGKLEITRGVVSGVGMYNGEPTLFVNGGEYRLSEVMVVGTSGDAPVYIGAETDQDPDNEANPDTETNPNQDGGGE